MRKYLFAAIFTMLTAMPTGAFAQIIVDVFELTNEKIAEVGKYELEDVIFEFKEGSSFPFTMSFEGSFFSIKDLKNAKLVAEVNRTFYFRFFGDEPLFSLDMDDWFDWKEFFVGNVMGAFGDISEDPRVICKCELNIRDFSAYNE